MIDAAASPRTLVIEGWRFSPHSYAVVNQFQCLELLRRPGVRLFHRDMFPFGPGWAKTMGLFDPEAQAAVDSIAAPDESVKPDAILRITFPYNLAPADVPRLCVFGTAEMGCVPRNRIAGKGNVAELVSQSPNMVIVTPSNWSRAGFINSGVDPQRVSVVPHGIDPSLHRPLPEDERAALRAQLGWNGFVFLSVGAMTFNKGLVQLFKAFASVVARHPDCILLMKGIDALYQSKGMLLRQVKTLTEAEVALIKPRLHYQGETLNFADITRMYQLADAYVSPYIAEGFNMPVLEAAACGTISICTAGGSTDDFARDEFALRVPSTIKTGNVMGVQAKLLSPNVPALVDHMLSVIRRPELRQRAREAGPAFAHQHFTWKHSVDRLLEVLFGEF